MENVRIELEGDAYDYPDDMPIPRIGEEVCINNVWGTVNRVFYQVSKDETEVIKSIYIHTKP